MDPVTQLEQIVSLSEVMLKEAEIGEWDDLIKTQQEREELIKAFFPINESCSNPEEVQNQVERIMQLDRQVMELAQCQQKDLGMMLSQFSTGRQATQAYKKNT